MKPNKFQSYVKETSGLVGLIESLPTATDTGAKQGIQKLREHFIETLSERDPKTGQIINPFPVETDPAKLIEFTKNYIGNEYGAALYKDHFKDYIDAFWEQIKNGKLGEGAALDFIINPMEKLAEKFKIGSNMGGDVGAAYNNLKAMMKQTENGGLNEEARAKIAKEFVDKLKDIQPRTKAYLKEYLTNNENKQMTGFYQRDIHYRMRDLVTANGKDFKAYATELGANTYKNGRGTGYEKLKTLLETTQGAENGYDQKIESLGAHARG
jgi:hypothetical protein